jgi:preprotein translocase subunit Sss1
MLGVIFGLFFLPAINEMIGSSSKETNTDGIDSLLSGVKIAMIASAIGLGLTIYTSGFLYKGAKQRVEGLKNKFYTFVQSQLLPKLSANSDSSLYTIQNNLLKFNDDFKSNMTGFKSILKDVHLTLGSQVELINELKKVDISTIARANVTVLVELKNSVREFEKFSQYMNNMNTFLANIKSLNFTVNEQLQLVGNVSEIVSNLKENAQHQIFLTRYLADHFKVSQSREQSFSDAIGKFDSSIGEMLEKLKLTFAKRAQEFSDIDIQLSEGFKSMFEDLRKTTTKLFDDEKANIKEIRTDVKQIHELKNEISKLVNALNEQTRKIENISRSGSSPTPYEIPKYFKYLIIAFLSLGIISFIAYLSFLILF